MNNNIEGVIVAEYFKMFVGVEVAELVDVLGGPG